MSAFISADTPVISTYRLCASILRHAKRALMSFFREWGPRPTMTRERSSDV